MSLLKPQPRVNDLTRPFWDGASARRLMIQRCTQPDCRRAVFYPRVCCPHCHGGGLEWIQASGQGSIVSQTTVRRTHHDGFNAEAPYVFAAVALKEGPIVYAQIPGAPLEESLTGRAVSVDYADHGPGRLMPVFRIA
ncbi:MAG: Zn-ribbon domain-containing OB-fold protein [Brevundimonas sp.]|jgi:uncharacterized OB-fold protein